MHKNSSRSKNSGLSVMEHHNLSFPRQIFTCCLISHHSLPKHPNAYLKINCFLTQCVCSISDFLQSLSNNPPVPFFLTQFLSINREGRQLTCNWKSECLVNKYLVSHAETMEHSELLSPHLAHILCTYLWKYIWQALFLNSSEAVRGKGRVSS